MSPAPHFTFVLDAECICTHLTEAAEHGLIDPLGGGQYAYQRHDTKYDDQQGQCCTEFIGGDGPQCETYILCEIHTAQR